MMSALHNAPSAADAMAVDQPAVKLTISNDEEELLALRREKDNDERQLRKISRKLHQYANARRDAAARAGVPTIAADVLEADKQTIDDAYGNVQIELDAFLLLMEKLELVRLAEERQTKEYEVMRENILKEHDEARDEISRLRIELKEAEAQREQRKEYDTIAERINTLQPRSVINGEIAELESEIAAIHAEQESVHEILMAKRSMMEDIRARISDMMQYGGEAPELEGVSPRTSPGPDTIELPTIQIQSGSNDGSRRSTPAPSGSQLNPTATPFRPGSSPLSSPAGGNKNTALLSSSRTHSHNNTRPDVSSPLAGGANEEPEDGEDVEMGEVAPSPAPLSSVQVSAPLAVPARKKHVAKEDLEEGEASDESSELSSLPGDD